MIVLFCLPHLHWPRQKNRVRACGRRASARLPTSRPLREREGEGETLLGPGNNVTAMSMAGVSRAQPGDKPCGVTCVGRTNAAGVRAYARL